MNDITRTSKERVIKLLRQVVRPYLYDDGNEPLRKLQNEGIEGAIALLESSSLEPLSGDALLKHLEGQCQAIWRTSFTIVCTLPKGHEGDHRADCGYTFNGEVDVRASQPPSESCSKCADVAPIAKLTVRDGLAVRAGLYAPGLPDGDHDVYPSASTPDRDPIITSLCDRIERIFCIAIDQKLTHAERIKQIQEWAAGFMQPPSETKGNSL